MQRYTVHLLFHLLAMVAGAACGVAAALWWIRVNPTALWLAVAALVVGIVVLVLQGLYISSTPPPYPPRARSAATASQPRIAAEPHGTGRARTPVAGSRTVVQSAADDLRPVDEETKGPAAKALRDFEKEWSARPPTQQS